MLFNLLLKYGDRDKEDVNNVIEFFKSKRYMFLGNIVEDILYLLFEKVHQAFTVKEALNKLEKTHNTFHLKLLNER